MVISYHLHHQLEIDMEVGDSAPDFELEANDGTKVNLKSFVGQNQFLLGRLLGETKNAQQIICWANFTLYPFYH